MAYFSQNGALYGSWLSGAYVPSAPITAILCDKCAQTRVPFTLRPDNSRQQSRPWKWAPVYGATCDICDTDC